MPALLEVQKITKDFPGVRALDSVSATLRVGEVLAIVGENGAGKSTLMKILGGVYTPDSGTITFQGQSVHFDDVTDAMQQGISLIHQELNLSENLSVQANIFLGRERYLGGPLGWLNPGPMRHEALQLMAKVGLDASLVDVPCGQLPPGQRQLVEIARALSLSVKVLIMDEPTSSLTQTETDRLYSVIEELKQSSVGVIYISHRLEEVKRIADRVTVLRDGHNAGELSKDEISHDALVKLMVGRDLQQLHSRQRPENLGPIVLELKNILYETGSEHPASLQVRAGEIVGMAGLVGAGRTELSEAIFGLRPIRAGQLFVSGKPVSIHSPTDAVQAGIHLIPEDRRHHGLVIDQTIRFNVSLPNLKLLSQYQWVQSSKERHLSMQMVDRLGVRTTSDRKIVGELSGGNQQKVVFGKWLAETPKILILDEPTRGVDVGARSEIYSVMNELSRDGVAILMITSDLEELLGMSDRVIVLHEGRVAGELTKPEFSEEAVMKLATGA